MLLYIILLENWIVFTNANFYTHNLKIKFDLTLPRPAQNCIHWPYKQDQKQILQVFYIQGIIPDFVLIINYSLLLVCLFLLLVLHNIQHLGRPEVKLTWFLYLSTEKLSTFKQYSASDSRKCFS